MIRRTDRSSGWAGRARFVALTCTCALACLASAVATPMTAAAQRGRVVSTADDEARVLYEEREADWEDQAANVSAAVGLEKVGDRERAELARIEAALVRLDGGEWGRCVGCNHPIAKDRLAAIPEATLCLTCSERREPRR